AETARRVMRDRDYAIRATGGGSDEIGVLVSVFNEMLGQIQRREEELSEASRLKDEFLATLSHELRTPLNAIVGWTKILQMGQADDAQRQRALEVIDRNCTALTRQIEDVLDVSRIVTGRMRVDLAPVDVGAAFRRVLEAVQPAATAKQI